MTPISPAPVSLSEKDLLEKYSDKIASVIHSELENDATAERLTQVAMALMHTEYFRGKQYVAPRLNKADGSISIESIGDDDGRDMFASVYNVYKSDCDKFKGAVCSHAPKAIVVPDDDEDEENVGQANEAGAHLRDFQRKFEPDQKQGELGENAWVTGPTFGYTPYVSDAHKYGSTENLVVEVQEVPFGPYGETLPAPTVTGTKRYPNGDVELHLANILFVTAPFKAKELPDAEWLNYEYMEHSAKLKSLYGKKLKDKNGNPLYDTGSYGDREQVFEAQERSVSPSGTSHGDWKKNRWRFSRWWLRPSLYSLFEGMVTGEGGDAVPFPEQLLEQFPDGLKIVMVNGKVVDIAHERMDDVWAVCKTSNGGTLLREPLGAHVVPIQKDLNTFFNMAKEIILRTIVKVAVDAQAFDREALKKNDPVIYECIPVEAGPSGDIGKLFAPFPTAKMPDGLERIAQVMMSLRREIGGVTEALFGGGQAANTYRAEKQRRDQSMMQFAPFFDCTRAFWKQVYRNAILQRSRHGSGRIKVPGENGQGSTMADAAMISEGGWHIEVEEGIPVSITEETDRAMWMMAESGDPDLPAKMGLIDQNGIPSEKFKRMVGIQGVVARGENERKKVQGIIQRLLKEPPISDMDPMTGQEITRPSIEPDPLVDDPQLFANFVRQWCNSPAGVKQQEKNPDGYEHVRAYLQAQQDLANSLAAPPPEEGGPPSEDNPPAPPQGEAPQPEAPGQAFDTAAPQI